MENVGLIGVLWLLFALLVPISLRSAYRSSGRVSLQVTVLTFRASAGLVPQMPQPTEDSQFGGFNPFPHPLSSRLQSVE
jgi:hypothetical protein